MISSAESDIEAAEHIWPSLSLTGSSRYLARKKIHGFGCRYGKNYIAIPVYKNGRIVDLQYIFDDGTKEFLKGTETRGSSFTIAGEGGTGLPVICNGYATGCSIRMATGFTVRVCFEGNNLVAIADQLASSSPLFIVAADNDHLSERNEGLIVAEKIFRKHQCMPRWPQFSPEDPSTNYNDLHVAQGLEVVKAMLLSGPRPFPGV